MNEPSISIARLGYAVLWAVTGTLLVAGWIVYPFGHADMALMLATSSCVTGLTAAVLAIKCYMRRYTRMILLGLSERRSGDGGGVRSMRR